MIWERRFDAKALVYVGAARSTRDVAVLSARGISSIGKVMAVDVETIASALRHS